MNVFVPDNTVLVHTVLVRTVLVRTMLVRTTHSSLHGVSEHHALRHSSTRSGRACEKTADLTLGFLLEGVHCQRRARTRRTRNSAEEDEEGESSAGKRKHCFKLNLLTLNLCRDFQLPRTGGR